MIPIHDSQPPPRQRSPRTDPDLRDGDSGHGNPGEPAGDLNAVDSDTDVEAGLPADVEDEPLAGAEDERPAGAGDPLTADAEDGLPGASPERQEEFETLVEEFEGEGRYPGRETEVAARIVNKQRREFGETAGQEAERAAGRAPDRELPIREYQRLTVPQVVSRAKGLPPDQIAEIVAFERAHRNRKTLLAQLGRLSGGN